MSKDKTALVLGANGGIGQEVSTALLRHGWRVRALARHVPLKTEDAEVDWIAGDAMNRNEIIKAAEGASVIVHGVNPPGYRDWPKLVVPMLDNTIAAAREARATVVLPGTIYNYGPDSFPLLSEGSPQHPVTRKGKLRVEMERRLAQAAEGGVRSIVVRAGDFFGARARNNWFSQGLLTPGRPVRRITYPGQPGVGHAWGYLPDVAETMVQLVERSADLAPFETFHLAGHWDPDGTAMIEAIRRAAGNRRIGVARFPWWLLGLARPFNTFATEVKEMRYLWKVPIRLDGSRLAAILGEEPHTPLDVAVRATLAALGCLGPVTA